MLAAPADLDEVLALAQRLEHRLVLDEPTNDLDMDTLDLLEDLLADYEGTLILVSHDRDFLDRVATLTIAMEGDGRATAYAKDFLFRDSQLRQPVASLSGGERNRLLLALALARPANLMVLDEPTNDLDIETLEMLEALLQDYDGTLFLVSHDRAFLDNVVTQTIAYEGDARWKEYAGGYTDWKRASKAGLAERERARDAAAPSPAAKDVSSPRKRGSNQLSYKETRELEALPAQLEALEREQEELTRRLADPALYQDRTVDLKALNAKHATNDAELTRLLERWEALEAKRAR